MPACDALVTHPRRAVTTLQPPRCTAPRPVGQRGPAAKEQEEMRRHAVDMCRARVEEYVACTRGAPPAGEAGLDLLSAGGVSAVPLGDLRNTLHLGDAGGVA